MISCNVRIGDKGAKNINLKLTITETDMAPVDRPSRTRASHGQTSGELDSLTEKHCPHTGRKASETVACVGVESRPHSEEILPTVFDSTGTAFPSRTWFLFLVIGGFGTASFVTMS